MDEQFELAAHLAGSEDQEEIEQYLVENYDLGWGEFCDLIDRLMPLIVIGKSPLTGKFYKGFGDDHVFFMKLEMSKKELGLDEEGS